MSAVREDDPAMLFLAAALDRTEMQANLAACLGDEVTLTSARIVRHKPGRRCLIEYVLRSLPEDGHENLLVLLGKLRAAKFDTNGFRVQKALWANGFGQACADDIRVPEPVGAVPDLHMWLQRKVAGWPATTLFKPTADTALARRVAEARVVEGRTASGPGLIGMPRRTHSSHEFCSAPRLAWP